MQVRPVNNAKDALDTSQTQGNAALPSPKECPCAGGDALLPLRYDDSRSSRMAIANFDDMCASEKEPEPVPFDEM